jgi:hypothetical protein
LAQIISEKFSENKKPPKRRRGRPRLFVGEPTRNDPTEASLFWIKLDEKLRRLSLLPDDEAKVRASIEERIRGPLLRCRSWCVCGVLSQLLFHHLDVRGVVNEIVNMDSSNAGIR